MACASQAPTALLFFPYVNAVSLTDNPAAAKYYRPYMACSWFSKAFGDAGVISDAISHGDFNRILYRYERRPSNIVEFCSYCWKMAKNAPFDKSRL